MEGEDSDGVGPFLTEDDYSILREDSLVRTMGSYNFSQLVSPLTPQEQQQVQPHLGEVYQYTSQNGYDPQFYTSQPNLQQPVQPQPLQRGLELQQVQHPDQYLNQQPQQSYPTQGEVLWDSMDEMMAPGEEELILKIESPPTTEPASVPTSAPSLQPWAGQFNFKISMATDNKDKNKWCYSPITKKLYLCPTLAVPVEVMTYPWVDAHIRVTPVYTHSRYRMEPVERCYNCKNKNACDPSIIDHLVQVECDRGHYERLPDKRYVVQLPLSQPPPGERSSTIFIKMMCMTSCVGGPNRRPFCLVITLHCNSTGALIGRQILDIKCCKCPSRDMATEVGQKRKREDPTPVPDEEKSQKVRKLASQIKVGQKRKKSSSDREHLVPKVEPSKDNGLVNIAVPAEFEVAVKKFINSIIAAKLIKRNQPELLLYPEVERENTDSSADSS